MLNLIFRHDFPDLHQQRTLFQPHSEVSPVATIPTVRLQKRVEPSVAVLLVDALLTQHTDDPHHAILIEVLANPQLSAWHQNLYQIVASQDILPQFIN